MSRTAALWMLFVIAGYGVVHGIALYGVSARQSRRMRRAGRNGGALMAYEVLRRAGWTRAVISGIGCVMALTGMALPATPPASDPRTATIHTLIAIGMYAVFGLNSYAALQCWKDKRQAELQERMDFDK